MSTVELIDSVETPSSILESEVIPSLDRILLDYGHRLRPAVLDDLRRTVTILEEIYSDLMTGIDPE